MIGGHGKGGMVWGAWQGACQVGHGKGDKGLWMGLMDVAWVGGIL